MVKFLTRIQHELSVIKKTHIGSSQTNSFMILNVNDAKIQNRAVPSGNVIIPIFIIKATNKYKWITPDHFWFLIS